jgi:hypothetical protein
VQIFQSKLKAFAGSRRTHTCSVMCKDYLHGIDEAYEDLLDDKV